MKILPTQYLVKQTGSVIIIVRKWNVCVGENCDKREHH